MSLTLTSALTLAMSLTLTFALVLTPNPQAIQKKAADYDSENGGKWDCRHLKLHLMSRYGIAMVDCLFYEIQMIVLRSLFRY